jgi:hypothetical protein
MPNPQNILQYSYMLYAIEASMLRMELDSGKIGWRGKRNDKLLLLSSI